MEGIFAILIKIILIFVNLGKSLLNHFMQDEESIFS